MANLHFFVGIWIFVAAIFGPVHRPGLRRKNNIKQMEIKRLFCLSVLGI